MRRPLLLLVLLALGISACGGSSATTGPAGGLPGDHRRWTPDPWAAKLSIAWCWYGRRCHADSSSAISCGVPGV